MADCFRVEAIGTLHGDTYINTFAVSALPNVLADPLDVTAAEQIAGELAVFYGGDNGAATPNQGIQPRLSTGFNLARVRVSDMRPFQTDVIEVSTPVVGTAADDALPNQVALVASIISSTGGRNGRGRIFVGGFTEASIDPPAGQYGRFDPDVCGDVIDALDDLAIRLAANVPPRQLGVLSRKLDTFFPAARFAVQDVPRSQRRRTNEVGAITILNRTA